MAKIIVTYYKMQERTVGKRMYYYEAFIDELRQLGNDVLVVNTAFFNTYESNVVRHKELDRMILKKAQDFNPDLIITFNHRIPQCILDNIDVPVIIWDGDSPLYLCDVDHIKENADRYKIFSISKEWYQDYMDMGFKSDSYAFMPNATSVRKKDMEQNMNITYLGTRIWTNLTVPKGMYRHLYLPQARKIVRENLNTGKGLSSEYLDKYFKEQKELLNWDEKMVYPLLEKRWLTLANVLDLGLTVCGSYSRWESVYEMMPQILAMYDPRRVWTLDENIDFYNSSKISLSPIHPQANGKAFPWRAFDVMASNACLVIERSSDFCDLIKDEVDIPVFDSPYEVRNICKELLENEDRRKEIVEQSQKWVEKNARWVDRFKETEQIVGVKLFNGNEMGSLEEIVDEMGILTESETDKQYTVRMDSSNVVTLNNEVEKKSLIGKLKEKAKQLYTFKNLFRIQKWVSILGVMLCFLWVLCIAGKCSIITEAEFTTLITIGLGINIISLIAIATKMAGKFFGYIKKKRLAN
ncbi:MAG: glycosyltransferase family 1 protein [Lachnospiraceae bacterium]|nr:glycosyltransferase family 1 protein [Lachnospiraceae bacterium]